MSLGTCSLLLDVFQRLIEAEPRRQPDTDARRTALARICALIPPGCYIQSTTSLYVYLDSTLVFNKSNAFYSIARSITAELCPSDTIRSLSLGRLYPVVFSDTAACPALDYMGGSLCMELDMPTYWLTKMEKAALVIGIVFTASMADIDKPTPSSFSPMLDLFSKEPSNKCQTHHSTYTRTIATQPVFDSLVYQRYARAVKPTRRHAMLALLGFINASVKYDFIKPLVDMADKCRDRLPDIVRRVPQSMYIGFCKLVFCRLHQSPSQTSITTDDAFKTALSPVFRSRIEASSDLKDMFNTAVTLSQRLFDFLASKRTDMGFIFNSQLSKRLEHSYRSMIPTIGTIPSVPTTIKALAVSEQNLMNTLEFVPFTVHSYDEMIAKAENVMDVETYDLVLLNSVYHFTYLLFDYPGMVAATMKIPLGRGQTYVPDSGNVLVFDMFNSVHDRAAVVVGLPRDLLFHLNIIMWCLKCSAHVHKTAQPASSFVGPHHMAYLLNHRANPVLSVMNAFSALMGVPVQPAHPAMTLCASLLELIGSNQHKSFENLPHNLRTSEFMQDTALLLFNPSDVWLIWSGFTEYLRLDIPDYEDVFDTDAQQVYIPKHVLVSGRTEGIKREVGVAIPKRRVIHDADTTAFNNEHRNGWVRLSSKQQLAVLNAALDLFKQEKATTAWSLLSCIALKVPCCAEYMDKVFPRHACGENGERSLGSVCHRVTAKPGHPAPIRLKEYPDTSRRALLVMIMCAFGHYTTFQLMAKQENQSSLHENKLTLWFDNILINDKVVFYPFTCDKALGDATTSVKCHALQGSLVVPVTSDTASSFAPLTLSLIDQYESVVAAEYLDHIIHIIERFPRSNSDNLNTPRINIEPSPNYRQSSESDSVPLRVGDFLLREQNKRNATTTEDSDNQDKRARPDY